MWSSNHILTVKFRDILYPLKYNGVLKLHVDANIESGFNCCYNNWSAHIL